VNDLLKKITTIILFSLIILSLKKICLLWDN